MESKVRCPSCGDIIDRSRYEAHAARHASGEQCPIDAALGRLARIFRR